MMRALLVFTDGTIANDQKRLRLLRRTYEKRFARVAARRAFLAGIGDRWDDSALHQELGIRSIIIRKCEGVRASVGRRLNA